MKCSDISSRLVDFLYEEIPPAERAEFSAHLASCPTCAAEVKASSRALQRTRSALRGPLSEEPPARVHASILAAARAAQPTTPRKPRVEEKEGFFARLWKAPWLIPAMGAAGVATAVFLIKVIKNPDVLPVREPASPPALLAKPQAADDKAAAPVARPTEAQAEALQAPAGKAEERALAGSKHSRAASGAAPPARPALRSPGEKKLRTIDDPLADFRQPPPPAAPPPVSEPATKPSEHAAPAMKRARPASVGANAPGAFAQPPPPPSLSESRDRKADIDELVRSQGASGAGAQGPRGELRQVQTQRAAEAPRPAPAPAAQGFALPPAPPAPAKSAPAPSESRPKAKRLVEPERADEEAMQLDDSAPLHSISAAKESDKKGSANRESLDDRVRKADKLYNEKKWSEAAAAYRALLAQAPNHPSAPTWRQRLVLAEKSQDRPDPIRAKAKTSADPLDGR